MYQLLRAHTKTEAGSLYEFIAFSDLYILTTNLLIFFSFFFCVNLMEGHCLLYPEFKQKKVNALSQDFIWICL